MRKNIFLLICVLLLLTGCKTIRQQDSKIEYRDRIEYRESLVKDSIYLRDSVFLYINGDTVYKEKYQILYKDRLRTDTVLVTDTLKLTKTEYVEVEKKVRNPLNLFLLGYFILSIIAIVIYKKIKR